jgi:hypothetical protein
MTNRYKGFLVTLTKNIREDDAEDIVTAVKMIKFVGSVKPYIASAEDFMLYERGYRDAKQEMWDVLMKLEKNHPNT